MQKKNVKIGVGFTTIVNSTVSLLISYDEIRKLTWLVESTIRLIGEPEKGSLVVYGQPKGTYGLQEQFVTFVHTKNLRAQSGSISYTEETDVMRNYLSGADILETAQAKLKNKEPWGIYEEKDSPRYMLLGTERGPLFTMFSMSGNTDIAMQEIYCTVLAFGLIYIHPQDKTLKKIHKDILSGKWGELIYLTRIQMIINEKLQQLY